MQEGQIQPAGDPYTYDYIESEDVFVVMRPRLPEKADVRAVGRKYGLGTIPYNKLLKHSDKAIKRVLAGLEAKIKQDPAFNNITSYFRIKPDEAREVLEPLIKGDKITRADLQKALIPKSFTTEEQDAIIGYFEDIGLLGSREKE